MRISYGVVALMGWLVALGFAEKSANADSMDRLRASNHEYEVSRAILQKGDAAYARGDYVEAFRLWKPLADRRNEMASYAIGLLYADGKGVPKDMAQARAYMETSAKGYWGPAQRWLKANGFALPPIARIPLQHEGEDLDGRPLTTPAKTGVCGNMPSLDPDTQQICRFAMPLCMFGPQAKAAMARGENTAAAIDQCVEDAVNRARGTQKSADLVARCITSVPRLEAGIRACTQAIQSKGITRHDKAVAYAYRAIASLGLDSNDTKGRAMADSKKATELDSSVGEAFLVRGEIYGIADYRAALENLDRAITRNLPRPLLGLAFFLRGLAHVVAAVDSKDMKALSEVAIRDFDQAIELDATDPRYFRIRANVEQRIGRTAAAQADLAAADRIDVRK